MKLLITIVFVGLIESVALAQDRIYVGVKAGVGGASLAGRDVSLYSSAKRPGWQPAYSLGLSLLSEWGSHFRLKHELLWTRKGAVLHGADSLGRTYDGNLQLAYLELYPFTPTYESGNWQLFAGPYVGSLLSARRPRLLPGAEPQVVTDRVAINQAGAGLHLTDVGLTAGVEYRLASGFTLSLRYVRGLKSIDQSYSHPDTWQLAKAFNQTVVVHIGYYFGRNRQRD